MNISRMIVLLFLTLFISSQSVFSDQIEGRPQGFSLTLAQCIALADKRNEGLQVQSDRQKEAREHLAQARGALLPTLDFNLSKFYRDTSGDTVSGEGTDSRFEVIQPVFSGFRKWDQIGFSKAEKLREAFFYQSLARQLHQNVAQVFYNILEIESDARNVVESMKLFEDRLKELDERVRLGKSRESEVLSVESQLAALKALGDSLDGQRKQSLETLSLLTGVSSSQLALSDTALPVTEAEPLEQSLLAARERSDIRTAQKDRELEEFRVRITKGALLPSANLDGSWYTARSGSVVGNWDLYLLVDVPLFAGGTLRSRVKEETFRLDELKQLEELQERQVDSEVRQVHHQLTSSLAQSAAYHQAFDKANRSYQLQKKEYRLGLVNNLDVLQALTTLLSVKSSYDRSLIELKLDKTLLDIATERF